jgi:hypothetical protein
LLFNYNLTDSGGAGWAYQVYNTSTGLYTGTDKYIINGYYGDWIIIKLPNPIVLSKFIFWARPGLINRSPGLWKCYGSNDGINYEERPEAYINVISLTQSSYVNNKYEKQTNNITKPYLYIGFVVRRLADIGATSDMVNFNEIRLYGREEILYYSPERVYPPKLYGSFTPEITQSGEILNISPTTYYKETITLNLTGIKYGIGDYIIYSSSSFLDVARTKARLFNKTYTSTIEDIGASWVYNAYNIANGSYTLSSYIKNDYLGDWCIVKFPKPITLKRYIFYGRDIFLERAPALWRFYGSNDGINFQIIQEG